MRCFFGSNALKPYFYHLKFLDLLLSSSSIAYALEGRRLSVLCSQAARFRKLLDIASCSAYMRSLF